MEVQHRRFEHLQEESAKVLSHLPQDSPGQEKIPAELEMVQDRLDCLVSIIEAQTQRVSIFVIFVHNYIQFYFMLWELLV